MSPKSSTTTTTTTAHDLETEAAELLRSVDFATRELNQTTLDAAREGEEARQNARMAAALIRRYAPHSHKTSATSSNNKTTTVSVPFPMSSSSSSSSPTSSAASSSPQPQLSAHQKLLNLSLELERCQRALKEEKTQHAVTQKALDEAHQRVTELETDVERFCHDQETLRQAWEQRNDELERTLASTQRRLESADQDAALALELAQHNTLAREEMEAWYQECLNQNQQLQLALEAQQQQHLPLPQGRQEDHRPELQYQPQSKQLDPSVLSILDNNAEETSLVHHRQDDSPGKSRAMVASGRQLLEQFRGRKVASPRGAAERAQERRRQTAERLKYLESSTTSSGTALTAVSHDAGLTQRIANLIQASGRRLSLPGRWWSHVKTSSDNGDHKDTVSATVTLEQTESLTKHYCQAVEVSVTGDWFL